MSRCCGGTGSRAWRLLGPAGILVGLGILFVPAAGAAPAGHSGTRAVTGAFCPAKVVRKPARPIIHTAGPTGLFRLDLKAPAGCILKQASAALSNPSGHTLTVDGADRVIGAPAGRYHLDALNFTLKTKSGDIWAYEFGNAILSHNPRDYPLVLAGKQTLVLQPLQTLRFFVAAPARAHPGMILPLTYRASTGMGLLLASIVRQSQDEDPMGEDTYVKATLASPAGKVLSESATGFL